ncbi:MAG: hydrogenase formation protein HypD [candidate division KSB1 bacterium]|nr:hydrogenase formation protein HypD [candidate division KSB1 bacterium]
MKYVDEFRDPEAARRLAAAIAARMSRPWTIMEICGGQTHAILKYGLEELLPIDLTLVHGPGCPVCVTPAGIIDAAVELASRRDVMLVSFGDMLRVPGSSRDLLSAKAAGGDVRLVYSPLDAVKLAQANPQKLIVFFAVGFETTAPANAAAVLAAKRLGLRNFFLLAAHRRVPPAMEAILSAPSCRVQAFLAAGHVCTVMGYREYLPIVETFRTPVVVTGFEPIDILMGILQAVELLEQGKASVANQYARVVTEKGNLQAQRLMAEVFEICDADWRGMGRIPASGLRLKPTYAAFDAEQVFSLKTSDKQERPTDCLAGKVLQGLIKPTDCPAFGAACRPETPLGAPMVSSEGACAAYFRYRQQKLQTANPKGD